MTSKEAHQLLLEQISTNQGFYKSLKRLDKGDQDQKGRDIDQEAGGNGDGGNVYYDEINSSQTIHEAIAGVVIQAPANQLADVYADRNDQESDESDAEDRGAGLIWTSIQSIHLQLVMQPRGGWTGMRNKPVTVAQ